MENISSILNNFILIERKFKDEETKDIKTKHNKSLLLTLYNHNQNSKNDVSKNKQNENSFRDAAKFKTTQEKRKISIRSPDIKIKQNKNHKINFCSEIVDSNKTFNTTIINTSINITNNITNIKNNRNKNESVNEETKSNNIGILDVAFGKYAPNEIKKKFKEDREREENIKKQKREIEISTKEFCIEKMKDKIRDEKKMMKENIMNNNFIDEENINDKNNNINEENKNNYGAINIKNSEEIENSKNNLILKESGIIFDADYNIFDMENIIDEDDDNDNNNEYNDYNSYSAISNKYENEINNEIIDKIDTEKKDKMEIEKNNDYDVNDIENDIHNKEDKKTEIRIEIKEFQAEANNLKFLIPFEDDITTSNKSSKTKTIKDNKENVKNNKNNSIQKVNKKVILDDESEEDVFFPGKDKKNNIKQINNKNLNNSVISNEGRKFTLCLGNDNKNITKKNKNEFIFLNQLNDILVKMKIKYQEINKENSNITLNKCFNIMADLKKENEVNLKNVFLGTLKILQYIFFLLGDTSYATKYIHDLINLLELIAKFHKSFKKNYRHIEKLPFYQIKKMSFKYTHSLLLLKTYNNDSLKTLKNENNIENLLKFTKIYKKYTKSSELLYKEIKNFKEKFSLMKNSSNLKLKYDSCLAHIQMSPNLMSYSRIFKHSAIILGFYTDKKEIDNCKNKNGYEKKIKERDRSRDRSIDESKLKNGHK